MAMMEDIEFRTKTASRISMRGSRGRKKRTKFGIVHYVTGTRQAYLIIPPTSGISVGDRISFYVETGGISFRVEKDGDYSVFKSSAASDIMRCTLCPELSNFAYHRTRDIIARQVNGGWFVTLRQFE